ncbi:MAG: hypothetical protein KF802_05545 [Bdellovibrionaceae bacterium]|nr:hypothetical protein [Pseudobdellovibrionaceae bacterium]MBX3032386.1 hypothetical protein [Pseudobdellovibrionaceae bacterium]
MFLKLFRHRAEVIASLGNAMGLRVRPYVNESLPYFRRLSFQQQEKICFALGNLIRIFNAAKAEMGSQWDSRRLIWTALKSFDFRPTADFFEQIEDDDIIQIYDTRGVQIFSNLKFFDVCSYNLEELYVLDWGMLWARDPEALGRLKELEEKVLTDDSVQSALVVRESHLVWETRSPLRLEIAYCLKSISPVWDRKTNRKAGFAVNEKGEIVASSSLKTKEMWIPDEARLADSPFSVV